MARLPASRAQKNIQDKKWKKGRNDDRLNKRKKFYSGPEDKAQMNIQNKKRKECGNDDRLNKRKKFYSWPGQKGDRRWQTTVPHNILSIISDLLPLSDFINFRGVCRDWRSVPSGRSNISKLSKKDPWCILYDFDAQDKDVCLIYQCNDRRSCSVKLPGLCGAKCFASKHGWLFIRRNNIFLFFNPLTLEEIFLPKYPANSFGSSACQVGTFSGSPSSKDCIAVLMSSRYSSTFQITSCHLAANKWVVDTFKDGAYNVACDSILLPSPRYVYFSPIKKISRLYNKDNVNRIVICCDSHILTVDCMFWWYKIESLLRPKVAKKYDKYFKIPNWYSKLKEVHYDDWICKFGKEFTFSFCLFNDFKTFDDKHVFGGTDDRTIPDVPVIKAAWLYND